MKAGWKNRIEERRYFEEKREKQREATQRRIGWRLQDEELQQRLKFREQVEASIQLTQNPPKKGFLAAGIQTFSGF